MRGELRVQARASTCKAIRMIGIHMKLLGQVVMHRFNNLPLGIEQPGHDEGQLPFLVAAWYRQQLHVVRCGQVCSQWCADVPFIAKYRFVGVFR